MLVYADQHFACDGNASKGVELPHDAFRIRDQVLILDTPVQMFRKISAVLKIA